MRTDKCAYDLDPFGGFLSLVSNNLGSTACMNAMRALMSFLLWGEVVPLLAVTYSSSRVLGVKRRPPASASRRVLINPLASSVISLAGRGWLTIDRMQLSQRWQTEAASWPKLRSSNLLRHRVDKAYLLIENIDSVDAKSCT